MDPHQAVADRRRHPRRGAAGGQLRSHEVRSPTARRPAAGEWYGSPRRRRRVVLIASRRRCARSAGRALVIALDCRSNLGHSGSPPRPWTIVAELRPDVVPDHLAPLATAREPRGPLSPTGDLWRSGLAAEGGVWKLRRGESGRARLLFAGIRRGSAPAAPGALPPSLPRSRLARSGPAAPAAASRRRRSPRRWCRPAGPARPQASCRRPA